MSKYKVGDKVVYEVKEIIRDGVYLLSGWKESEPLNNYTEPLEAKIRRQAAEITRLLRENNELKEQMKFDLPTLISEEDKRRMDINKARAEGAEAAWELARKIILLGGYTSDDLEEIFNCSGYHKVMKDFTYPEAAAKVEAWEKAKKEIKDDEDCLKCQFFEKHNDEYPCSHCCHCYTSKFKQMGGEE